MTKRTTEQEKKFNHKLLAEVYNTTETWILEQTSEARHKQHQTIDIAKMYFGEDFITLYVDFIRNPLNAEYLK